VNFFPALNTGTVLAGMFNVSLVCGFKPVLAARRLLENVPKPGKEALPPAIVDEGKKNGVMVWAEDTSIIGVVHIQRVDLAMCTQETQCNKLLTSSYCSNDRL